VSACCLQNAANGTGAGEEAHDEHEHEHEDSEEVRHPRLHWRCTSSQGAIIVWLVLPAWARPHDGCLPLRFRVKCLSAMLTCLLLLVTDSYSYSYSYPAALVQQSTCTVLRV
jgi:hypothetical protein